MISMVLLGKPGFNQTQKSDLAGKVGFLGLVKTGFTKQHHADHCNPFQKSNANKVSLVYV